MIRTSRLTVDGGMEEAAIRFFFKMRGKTHHPTPTKRKNSSAILRHARAELQATTGRKEASVVIDTRQQERGELGISAIVRMPTPRMTTARMPIVRNWCDTPILGRNDGIEPGDVYVCHKDDFSIASRAYLVAPNHHGPGCVLDDNGTVLVFGKEEFSGPCVQIFVQWQEDGPISLYHIPRDQPEHFASILTFILGSDFYAASMIVSQFAYVLYHVKKTIQDIATQVIPASTSHRPGSICKMTWTVKDHVAQVYHSPEFIPPLPGTLYSLCGVLHDTELYTLMSLPHDYDWIYNYVFGGG